MSPDHWSILTWDTVSAGGYDLFDPIGYLDRKRDRAYKQRVIVTPAIVNILRSDIDEPKLQSLHNKSQEDTTSINIVTKQQKTDADELLEQSLLTFNTERTEKHVNKLSQQLATESFLSDNISTSIDIQIEQKHVKELQHDEHSMSMSLYLDMTRNGIPIQSFQLLNPFIAVPEMLQDDHIKTE